MGKSWTSIFLKEDPCGGEAAKNNDKIENTNASGQPLAEVNAPAIASAVVAGAVSAKLADSSAGAPNEETVRSIWNVLISKNLPGPDFMEVKNCAASLASMGLSEQQRYEAAVKMLMSSYPSFSKDTLLKSIDTYVGFVEEERTVGMQQCDQKRKAEVGDKKARVAQLEQHADDLRRQIADLQKECDGVAASVETMKSEIADAERRLDESQRAFEASVDAVIEGLKSDRKTMAALNV